MITSERLDEIEAECMGDKLGLVTSDDIKELIWLARLGLWAEGHAIPALRKCVILNGTIIQSYQLDKPVGPERYEGNDPTALVAWAALSALPKDAP